MPNTCPCFVCGASKRKRCACDEGTRGSLKERPVNPRLQTKSRVKEDPSPKRCKAVKEEQVDSRDDKRSLQNPPSRPLQDAGVQHATQGDLQSPPSKALQDAAVQTDLEGDLLHHYYERKAAWALEKEQLQTDNARISKALAKAEAQLDTYRGKEAGWALKLGEERGALAQARSQLEAKEAAEERRRAESRARWTTQG